MKQQNDYSLLMNEYYKQEMTIERVKLNATKTEQLQKDAKSGKVENKQILLETVLNLFNNLLKHDLAESYL